MCDAGSEACLCRPSAIAGPSGCSQDSTGCACPLAALSPPLMPWNWPTICWFLDGRVIPPQVHKKRKAWSQGQTWSRCHVYICKQYVADGACSMLTQLAGALSTPGHSVGAKAWWGIYNGQVLYSKELSVLTSHAIRLPRKMQYHLACPLRHCAN